jgi:ABC-type multidrug transport system fused ATPase/permease subunit
VSHETLAIEEASGEKISNIVTAFVQLLGGIIVAFTIDWKLTLIVFAFVPVGVVAISILALSGKAKMTQVNANKAASYSEQAMNLVKIVVAFGQEKLEETSFNKMLLKSRREQYIISLKLAFAYGFLHFVIFAWYSYGLGLGGYLAHI